MRKQGFTLIEIIVAIAIFSVLSLGVIALVSSIFTGTNKQSTLLADSDQARRVGFQITNELRNAVTANTGAYAIDTANAQTIIFYTNVDSDNTIERVRYYIQGTQLWRGVINPSGNPLSYVPGNEATMAVQNNLANGATPLFYYYDENYNGTGSALAQPVNVTNIRYVSLNLMISNKAGIGTTNSYTVTAGGAIRSLKTNLGN